MNNSWVGNNCHGHIHEPYLQFKVVSCLFHITWSIVNTTQWMDPITFELPRWPLWLDDHNRPLGMLWILFATYTWTHPIVEFEVVYAWLLQLENWAMALLRSTMKKSLVLVHMAKSARLSVGSCPVLLSSRTMTKELMSLVVSFLQECQFLRALKHARYPNLV